MQAWQKLDTKLCEQTRKQLALVLFPRHAPTREFAMKSNECLFQTIANVFMTSKFGFNNLCERLECLTTIQHIIIPMLRKCVDLESLPEGDKTQCYDEVLAPYEDSWFAGQLLTRGLNATHFQSCMPIEMYFYIDKYTLYDVWNYLDLLGYLDDPSKFESINVCQLLKSIAANKVALLEKS